MDKVNRRHALRALAGGAAGVAASASWVESLSALSRAQAHAHAADGFILAQEWAPRVLTVKQSELVDVLTELILPTTDTPGARAARVNRFIDTVLHDAPPPIRESFLQGLSWIDERSRLMFGREFIASTTEQQTTLLTAISAEGRADDADATGRDFFRAIKSMTINGYYTTPIGLRTELGDSGQLFLPTFAGCNHPEHQ